MKNLLIAVMLLVAGNTRAQFFSQQSNKEKLMISQIAAFQIYLQSIKTGYHIAQAGLNTTQQLKSGTFNLHTAYFSSLAQVNPLVSNNPKGKAVIKLVTKTGSVFSTEITWQQQQKQLTVTEMNYLQTVFDNLVDKCQSDMSELTAVLTPGKLQLTDQERLNRLDKIYVAMQDKYVFACSFTSQCRTLATSRAQSKSGRSQLKQLYGIQ